MNRTVTIGKNRENRFADLLRRFFSKAWSVPLVLTATTVLSSVFRICVVPTFFYWDDTQAGAVGQLYWTGLNLLDGRWQFFNPEVFSGGNYLAEGQWGLFNPMILLWSVLIYMISATAAVITSIKIFYLVVLAVGTYFLAIQYGAARAWAFFAGLSMPLTGVILYVDSPSWLSDLQNIAMLVWAMWSLNRLAERRSRLSRGAVTIYVLSAYFLITQGYVYGVLALICFIVIQLLLLIRRKTWQQFWLVAVLGFFSGCVTLLVYLPGVLSAGATLRTGGISNDFYLNLDLSDLLTSVSPIGTTSISGFWGPMTPAPVAYITWALPLLVFALPVGKSLVRCLAPMVIFGAIWLAFIVGPSAVGPLRYPFRALPFLALAILICFAAIMTQWEKDRNRLNDNRDSLLRRGAIAIGISLFAAWIGFSESVPSWWRVFFVFAAQSVAILLIVRIRMWQKHYKTSDGILVRNLLPIGAALATIILFAIQTFAFPVGAMANWNAPTTINNLRNVYGKVAGPIFPVGNPLNAIISSPDAFTELTTGNLSYATGVTPFAGYSVMLNSAMSEDLCITEIRGGTCADSWNKLFSKDADTGVRVIDLLGINSLNVVKTDVPHLGTIPKGWRVAANGMYRWVIVRDTPLPVSRQVVYASQGTSVTQIANSDTSVRLQIENRSSKAGIVVLKRVDWPGYSVSGSASITKPLRGYLLTLKVPAHSDSVTTVRFRPPGYWIMVVASILALFSLLCIPFIGARARKKSSDTQSGSLEP